MKKTIPINRENTYRQNISELEKVEIFLLEKYEFRYNEIANEVEYREWRDHKGEFEVLRIPNLWRELTKAHFRINISNLEALFASDFVAFHNPFNQYFEQLPQWNAASDPDYIELLAYHVKARDQERFNRHLKKHLVRTIACALDSSFFNKHAFILIGRKQNTGKSTWCRFLMPQQLSDYYSENFETDKDGEIAMSRNFIINLDELASLNKHDIKKLKALFSYVNINRRHPYGRKPVITPRRASFFGSTNEFDFLEDETGSVRWLCFEIDSIDWSYTQIDINKVWSQAYHLYVSRTFSHQLSIEEIKENEQINKAYLKPSPERDILTKFYAPGHEYDYDFFYQTTELLEELNSKLGKGIRLNYVSLGKALTALGYERKSKRLKGKNPVYGYYLKIRKINDYYNNINLPEKDT